MPKPLFEIPKWGPKKLREILEKIQNQINERTPLESETIGINELPNGMQICVLGAPGSGDGGGDSPAGGGGTSVDIYGARLGAAAVFHLLQTSPPSAPPP